ncbi:MAG: NADH:ubiquinone oxidoreductase [Roseiflexaceae bacterium]|nr:NADH:ubiquinone oxidoreductase [Roseiflexaceae bacterium]
MIKLFRMNTGSCGACDAEIEAAVLLNRDLAWAGDPFEADVLLLTGPLLPQAKLAFLAIWHKLRESVPLVAVGRCAIDGYPFGQGGLAANPEIVAALKVDGCPPDPGAIAAAVHEALTVGIPAS